MAHVCERLGVSERRACRTLNQARATQRYAPRLRDDETLVTERTVALAVDYGRYGYRRITGLLRNEGWRVNPKRIARIWRREGLKVPKRHRPRRRLWLGDGSCIRLRPQHKDHVWAYDFVATRTHDGRALRLLTIVDEFTRECLAIDVARRLTSEDVLARLTELFVFRGVPDHIRSDNGSEFTAKEVRRWLARLGVRTLYIEPGSPWENGYCESFNGKLRDELLDGEIFDTLEEARVLVERWRRQYNEIRPHSALGYRPPAPVAIEPRPRMPSSTPLPKPNGFAIYRGEESERRAESARRDDQTLDSSAESTLTSDVVQSLGAGQSTRQPAGFFASLRWKSPSVRAPTTRSNVSNASRAEASLERS